MSKWRTLILVPTKLRHKAVASKGSWARQNTSNLTAAKCRVELSSHHQPPAQPGGEPSAHGRMGRRLTEGVLLSRWKWVVQVYHDCIRQTHVCICVPPIGWWAHQADNRGRWLVHTLLNYLLNFLGRPDGKLFLTVVPILPCISHQAARPSSQPL